MLVRKNKRNRAAKKSDEMRTPEMGNLEPDSRGDFNADRDEIPESGRKEMNQQIGKTI